ncbi:MAG TPA: glycoside hydrolase domain-containing protein [Gemmatimonadaceae bacterium]|nr:glycoside hydrolase domain-containing protein [Gemmatimonadaceae bacterium]
MRTRLPLLLLATGGVACTSAPPAAPPSPRYPAHPGFDSYYYPGDAAMRAWRAPASPYEWVGYYLTAPCHRDPSWAGRRAALDAMGWGIAVLYVGQQTWEGQAEAAPPPAGLPAAGAAGVGSDTTRRTPADSLRADSLRRATPAGDRVHAVAPATPACAPAQLMAGRGEIDAADAARQAAAEGFPTGTVIYLNVERMDSVPAAMHDYVRAWARALLADGRYRPGLYVHVRNAAALAASLRAELAAAGLAGEPRLWVANAAGFDLTRTPAESGHPSAAIWQGAFDVRETWGGVTLRIDANVARDPAPSGPVPGVPAGPPPPPAP